MDNASDSADSEVSGSVRLQRAPLAIIAIAFTVGILIDRAANLPLTMWLAGTCLMLIAWGLLAWRRRPLASAIGLLLAWTTAGAGSHHLVWSTADADDISRRATKEATPIELVASIEDRPSIRGAVESRLSVLPPVDRTLCRIRVKSVREGDRDLPASGLAQLIVSGHLLAERGDVIRLHGEIQLPSSPGNPGEFDYRAFLRRQQVRCIVRVNEPAAIDTPTATQTSHPPT